MNRFKSHFRFSRQERSGIFFLLLIIVAIQVIIFIRWNDAGVKSDSNFEVDSIVQSQIDSLKKRSLIKDSIKVFPFNPNFITDYKGYTLGLSVEEIDRLHQFRANNEFINTADEFQIVTGVSDSLLNNISPYFKFPEWTQKKSQSLSEDKDSKNSNSEGVKTESITYDLNLVTAEDLQKVNGIGSKLSARIIKFRDRLGGFLVNEQLFDVYGLEPDVVNRALKLFVVKTRPEIEPININTATIRELSGLIYINSELAVRIIQHREAHGAFSSINELSKIQGFPTEKIHNIQLYLTH